MSTTVLYGIDSVGRNRIWTMEVEGNRYRTISGLMDGAKVTSEWTVCEGKNLGRANATTPEQQAQLQAESIIRDRLEKDGYHYTLEDARSKGKSFFQPMLAKKWSDLNQKGRDKFFSGRVFVQPKLDGIRCIINKDGMWTRQGKPIISAPHIRRELEPIFELHPDLILDGELYCHKLNNDFNKIISLVRKAKPTAEDLAESEKYVQFWNYDIPSEDTDFADRNRTLQYIYEKEIPELGHPEYFVYVDTYACDKPEYVDRWHEKMVSEGYEGAILRKNAKYECKRSDNLLKVKSFIDEEFTILDVEEGVGGLAGKAGAIVCAMPNGNRFRAGLNFSHDDMTEVWENKDKYIGKTATVAYFNITPDGNPRFPRCTQIARETYE